MEKKFKLVAKTRPLQNANNFWQCCPLNREYLPEEACPEGTSTSKSEEPKCQWWIASAEHDYCFWRYIKDKSSPDGSMKELVQSELAALFGWSNTKTHFMLKQAMAELTEALKLYGAIDLLQDIDAEESDGHFVIDDFIEPDSQDPTE